MFLRLLLLLLVRVMPPRLLLLRQLELVLVLVLLFLLWLLTVVSIALRSTPGFDNKRSARLLNVPRPFERCTAPGSAWV